MWLDTILVTTTMRHHHHGNLPFALLAMLAGMNAMGQTQGKDGKGESVFDYYDAKVARVQSSIKDPLELSFTTFLDSSTWIHTGTGDTTVTKQHRLIYKLAAVNIGDKFIVENLAEARIGGRLNVGWQIGMDRIAGLKNNDGIYGTWGFGVSAFIGVDNILLYSASDSTTGTVYPRSIGLTMAANHLHRACLKGKLMWMLSGGLTLESTWNKDELIPFVSNGQTIALPGAIAFEKPNGSYGRLEENLLRARLYGSIPIYYGKFSGLPYCALRVRENTEPFYRLGFLLGFTGVAPKWENFELPSVLSIGIDWTSSAISGWSEPTYFLTGSFKLK